MKALLPLCFASLLLVPGGSRQVRAQARPQAAVTCPVPTEAKPWLNPSYAPECRARFVLQALKTVDDKFAFLQAGRGGPRGGAEQRNIMVEMGLVRGGGSDGPAGVRGTTGVTALPTPLSVSASFDIATYTKYGEIMGQEFQAAGLNSMTGPAMDLARTWHFGRVTESYGEDPFLEASIAGAEIKAIQAQHVVATMKHFTAYNQEQGRSGDQPTGTRPGVDQIISERALREMYLPAFHGAVAVGGAGSTMCSFPIINGSYACENAHTLGILKNEFGFEGMVVPDFPDAQRTIVPAFLAGLDQGTLAPATGAVQGDAPAFAGQKSLRAAVDDGSFPMSRLDDMILRRLVVPFRIGVFEHPAKKLGPDGLSTPERRAAAAEVVTAGAVLLKNDKALLPFGPAVHSIAVIGVQATDKAVVVEQGSGYVIPTHVVPALAAIEGRAVSGVKVSFAAGTLGLSPLPAVPAGMLKTPKGEAGVMAEYFANPKSDFSGTPLAVRTVPMLDFDKVPVIDGLPANLQWSARFTTEFTPAVSGVHKFTLNGSSEAHLYIGGKLMGSFMRADFQDTVYASVALTAGKPVEIRVEYGPREAFGVAKRTQFGISFGPYLTLGWAAPDHLIEEAAAAAKKADVAVVFVGMQVGEGMDRLSLSLANDQNALIEAVAKANPRTVVMLNTGGAVTMPWLRSVGAVLEAWLPGDAIGPASAKLLFGDADPGGRLPVTFPADEAQGPAQKADEYPGTTRADGSLEVEHFDEGIFVGYRYWDEHGQKPLFPFGYGLSYTQFTMSGMKVMPTAGGGATVDVTVKNVGKRAGSDVAQVYVGFPKSAGEPPKQLKAFGKVTLAAGAEQTLHLALDADAFKYWNESTNGWATAPGAYAVMVGTSSRDIAWTGSVSPGQ